MIGAVERVESALWRFGFNSNSFFSLYRGFRYFSHPDARVEGWISYVETGNNWVGISEPLADDKDHEELLRAFSRAAAEQGRRAILIPVRKEFLARAESAGYAAVQIGSEPVFHFDRYEPKVDRVETARRIQDRGARVSEFSPSEAVSFRTELDEIVEEWLDSRKMAPLRFLNRVEPFERSEHKRYFRVELSGKTLAFIAAIPYCGKKSWYLVDVLKRNEVPPGTTELLILETMRILKAAGAREVSLGVAPLAGLPEGRNGALPAFVNRILRWTFEYGGLFYNFSPLYRFKLKFAPTSVEPAYVIFGETSSSFSVVSGLSGAFLPGGVTFAVSSGILRWVLRWMGQLSWTMSVRKDVVARAAPASAADTVRRLPFSGMIAMASIVPYFFTRAVGERWLGSIDPAILRHAGFSWTSIGRTWPWVFFSGPFLHHGISHLALNLLSLAIFVGGLELLAGTFFASLCFMSGALTANLLTVLCVGMPLRWINPAAWEAFASSVDVGASLGIWGCAGGLVCFIERGSILAVLLALGAVFASGMTGDWFQVNHIFALIVGVVAAKLLLRR